MAAESVERRSSRPETMRGPDSSMSVKVGVLVRARVQRRLRAVPCFDLKQAQATAIDIYFDAVADHVASSLKD